MDMQTQEFSQEALAAARIEELRFAANNVNAETQLSQAKTIAKLLVAMCETPNQIRGETIGWVGSLLGDVLARLELALEIESQERLGAKVTA